MSEAQAPGPMCATCGAPDNGDFVTCRFCRNPVNAEAARTAIPCPNQQCRTQNRWGKQKCGACQQWLVVQCVFCGSLSPHNMSNCMQCNEAFAGSHQRKAQMQQQQQHHQQMQQVNAYAPILGAFAGAAAGSIVGHGVSHAVWHSGPDYEYDAYDSGSVAEDAGGFFDSVADVGGGLFDD